MVKRSRVQEHINHFHRQQEKKIGKTLNGDISVDDKMQSKIAKQEIICTP